jgi:ABC-type lipoprotein release transport system permease subunit
LLALPLSWVLGNASGTALILTSLAFTFSAVGVLSWLAVMAVISVVASLLPARGAWRVSVREVLACE